MYIDFITQVHKSTKRDYLGRVNDLEIPKWKAAEATKDFGYTYFDEPDRRYNYGGYYYQPGRWDNVINKMKDHYGIKPGDRILDVGCAKGFMLHDFTKLIPGVEVSGIDISQYAKDNAKEEVKDNIVVGNAKKLPFEDDSFDLVISLNTLHNMPCYEMLSALKEIERVGKKHKYIVVESWRNEEEKVNLLYWQVTCRCFFAVDEWDWWFQQANYTGDHSFIYFE